MIPSKIFQVISGDVWFQEGRCSTPHNVSHRVEKGRSPKAKSTATSGRLKGSWKNRRFLEGIGRIGNPKLSSTLRHQDTHPQSGWRTKCPFEWSCTLRLNFGDLSPPKSLGPLNLLGWVNWWSDDVSSLVGIISDLSGPEFPSWKQSNAPPRTCGLILVLFMLGLHMPRHHQHCCHSCHLSC